MRLDIRSDAENMFYSSSNSECRKRSTAGETHTQNSYTPAVTKLSLQIINILFNRRRLLDGQERLAADSYREYEPHVETIKYSVSQGIPLILILPGFPAKSPNRKKTLGPLPDLAEKYAIQNLLHLCNEIKSIYTPGAKIKICSDGRVFSDLVLIDEKDVTHYGEHLKAYTLEHFKNTFEFFNLDDIFQKMNDFDMMREELLIRYGESIESLRKRCKTDKSAETMYKGITRFIFEDYSGLEEFSSNSRSFIQRKARSVAYRVIQRSNAWSRLLEQSFHNIVRLSIHPQLRVSNKIGVFLVETQDCWQTPWHSVAVKQAGRIRLMARKDAEKQGLLAFEGGYPSHFEILEPDHHLSRDAFS